MICESDDVIVEAKDASYDEGNASMQSVGHFDDVATYTRVSGGHFTFLTK